MVQQEAHQNQAHSKVKKGETILVNYGRGFFNEGECQCVTCERLETRNSYLLSFLCFYNLHCWNKIIVVPVADVDTYQLLCEEVAFTKRKHSCSLSTVLRRAGLENKKRMLYLAVLNPVVFTTVSRKSFNNSNCLFAIYKYPEVWMVVLGLLFVVVCHPFSMKSFTKSWLHLCSYFLFSH